MSKISGSLVACVIVALVGAGCSLGTSDNGSDGGNTPATQSSSATAAQMAERLKFAACMRDNGVKNFPDPKPTGPIINVRNAQSIPGFQDALNKCRDLLKGGL
jgi:hypothetical protein